MKEIIGVVSAYGAMTECDNRYKVLIHAENAEEFNAKLKAFMCAETVRALSSHEIALELGPVDPKKVYAALEGFTLPEEGEREVLEVPELRTDYCHGTIKMTASELAGHLLGWDRHVIPVM